KNGILSYPHFVPYHGFNFNIAVETAEYILQIPKDYQIREKQQNIKPEKYVLENDTKIYKYSVKNLKALPKESFIAQEDIFPVIYLSPEKFCVEKNCGNMSSWQNFGKWQSELLKGRNILPQSTIDKVLELTNGITDKRQKVKILYEFMQKTTHYVSIQLGVGGWQPIAAADVAKTGFGDCKALSNYMKALLATVEIPSFYTVISTNKKRFFSDFPSFGQANHVILTVPLDTDTVYLECTSQLAPFGFISDLAGHDCLLVGDNEVRFFTIPAYKKYENLISNSLKISLNESGTANLQVHTSLRNEDFEQIYYTLKAADETEKNKALAGLLRVQKPKISNFSKEEKLDERPQIDLKFDVTCEDFASLTGQRMVLKINPFRVSFRNFLTGNKRKFDIDISNSHIQTDSIVIDIPAGYAVEIKPKSTIVSTKYGSFITTATFTDTQVTYVQMLTFNQGKYSASEFDEIKKFCVQLDNLQNSDIGFKKSEK
ncbi:MAG: hypothetical protein LBV75_03680, partial [Paludibacter sp.]|nr:hypothetical protein [Paludibacter sp.]